MKIYAMSDIHGCLQEFEAAFVYGDAHENGDLWIKLRKLKNAYVLQIEDNNDNIIIK